MNPISLTDEDRSLLRQILESRRADLIVHLDNLGSGITPSEIVNELQNVVSEEFVETGLDRSQEPNARGLLLESLIDRLGRLRRLS